MGIITILVTVFTITSVVKAQYFKYPVPKKYNPAAIQAPAVLPQNFAPNFPQKYPQQYPLPTTAYLADPNQNPASSYLPLVPLQRSDSYLPIPLVQQLPKIEASQVPFYTPAPSTVLKAPESFNQANNYFQIPVPSQDLQVPTQLQWNPENDPTYLYDIPKVVPVKQEAPTNLYPKKYSKDVHATAKPYAAKYKKFEDPPRPLDDKANEYEQKRLAKTLQNLAKHENQKRIQAEKVQKVSPGSGAKSPVGGKSEPQVAETGFSSGFDAEGVSHHHGGGFTQDIKAALEHNHHSPKERVEFHMHGHDGPHSYKWGFDHGEGHDRQFRFEERDKNGVVKGLYGYYDKHGKLQMVNYDSHPHIGFHADTPLGKF